MLYTMLCCDILCYVMLFCIMLCYGILSYDIYKDNKECE